MPYPQMADHALERFGVGRHVLLTDPGDHHARVGYLSGIAVGPTHDADDSRAYLPGKRERMHDVRGTLLEPTPDREHYDYIFCSELAHRKPAHKCCPPTIVIGSSRQLGDVVRRRVGFDAQHLAQVVDEVGRVRRAPTYAEHKYPTANSLDPGQDAYASFDLVSVNLQGKTGHFLEIVTGKRHSLGTWPIPRASQSRRPGRSPRSRRGILRRQAKRIGRPGPWHQYGQPRCGKGPRSPHHHGQSIRRVCTP